MNTIQSKRLLNTLPVSTIKVNTMWIVISENNVYTLLCSVIRNKTLQYLCNTLTLLCLFICTVKMQIWVNNLTMFPCMVINGFILIHALLSSGGIKWWLLVEESKWSVPICLHEKTRPTLSMNITQFAWGKLRYIHGKRQDDSVVCSWKDIGC